MAREVSGKLRIEVDLVERSTLLGDGTKTAAIPHSMLYEALISTGLSDGQLDRIHTVALSITSGTPLNIDLAGSLTSALGSANNFADLCLLIVRNTASVGTLQVGGNVNSVPVFAAANDIINVGPGGLLFWYSPAGVTVTAGTGDILQIAASTGTITGVCTVAGRSA